MRIATRILLATVAAIVLSAALRAGTTKGDAVQFVNGKDTVNGFLVQPEKPGRYAAIVVAPEWRGMTDWVKEQASKLAEQGYVALVVDFYGGKVASNPEEASDLAQSVSSATAVGDLRAAITYLQTAKEVDRDHIAAIGWGTGGGYVAKLATQEPRLGGVIVNYGMLPTDPNDMQLIGAPMLGNFGAEDHGVPEKDVRSFEKFMKTLQRRVDIKVYDGAGNQFANSTNTQAYRPAAAEDAWKRTVDFLGRTMK